MGKKGDDTTFKLKNSFQIKLMFWKFWKCISARRSNYLNGHHCGENTERKAKIGETRVWKSGFFVELLLHAKLL